MEEAKRLFRKKLDQTGVALTVAQLEQLVRKNKLAPKGPEDQAVTRERLRKFISEELSTAKFAPVRRPKHFQTINVLRPGVFFIDYAEFRPDLKHFNNGNTGFLVGVQNVTNQLFVTPCGNKSTESWLRAVETFVERTQNVR